MQACGASVGFLRWAAVLSRLRATLRPTLYGRSSFRNGCGFLASFITFLYSTPTAFTLPKIAHKEHLRLGITRILRQAARSALDCGSWLPPYPPQRHYRTITRLASTQFRATKTRLTSLHHTRRRRLLSQRRRIHEPRILSHHRVQRVSALIDLRCRAAIRVG